VKSIRLEEVRAVAPELIHPDNLTWVIVGDREKILPGIKALNIGEVKLIDADGNPVGATM